MKGILLLLASLLLTGPVKTDNVVSRFKAPAGYKQCTVTPGSFAAWLQAVPLKPYGSQCLTYQGKVARTEGYTAGILDVSVGNYDLQQCADAVMRLRGEYLYSQKKYQDISFNFTSGFKCDFVHYANGYRYSSEHWVLKAKKDYSYPNFMRYMMLVFSYAGTLSLEKELKPVQNPATLKTGDVFIKGGSPGHCFIVMNVVENAQHQKKFLIAQSYMPAQSIQLLQYQEVPWFSLNEPAYILYGALVSPTYLKRFE
ncbi:DUF4846 domain-containing protein [Mucilaginibacter flavus]|uniref:DUF4846 domain-containing protein n=1 Tax=Mucilaginibacter flavus TaxID=931504 RepID=UPI0025B6050E|nr:DUF4846 domain-containing protein [Mucilaginibacter flavus]MDN3581506.1 DUF4846 domain-containing protein [Mucilaginibacter flavus]